MKFDDALQIVGEIGRYQISKVIPLSMVIFTTGVQIMITVFTLNVPDHRWGVGGTLDSETALRCAGTFLSWRRVRIRHY
ncbi:organic cation transporter protein [Plakobranchus ocellatus]|uniref:Organic cation transporter protein n=1 Tax=Plakobranchus ocellatus TaxID=259542 RepID=A0AAV4A5T1_9GAST|nr:organic cation transporter protein [Plakobranchus ocellatus]